MHNFKRMAEPKVQLRAAGLRDGGRGASKESFYMLGWMSHPEDTRTNLCQGEQSLALLGQCCWHRHPVAELLQQRAEDNLGGFGQGKTACTTCDLLPQSPSRAPLNASMTNTNISC